MKRSEEDGNGSTGYLTIDQLLAIRPVGGTEAPQWAPDGSGIMFASGMGGSPELWSVCPETGTLTRLSVGMGGVGHLATFLPQWSPTGEYVAFVSAKTGVDEIWLWPVDGGPVTQLTHLGARVEAFSWSPDGTSIVLASNAYGAFDIFVVEVPTGNHRRLTDGPLYDVYPRFTPDGQHILYVELNDSWTDHDVIRVGVDGSNPEVILKDTNFFDYHYGRTFGYPNVSPDGSTFLFRSDRDGWINIWAAPVDGSGEAWQIAPAAADQSDAVWSPDGTQIAYIENHNGTLDLRTVPFAAGAVGGEPTIHVAPDMGVCGTPAWSPDGSKIAYLFGTPLSPNDIWTVDVASGEQRQLTRSMLGGDAAKRLVKPEKVAYETFDGRTINAYLYRPAHREPGQRFPGILWVHGGPTSQFADTWQAQVQYFVSQGYVLLLPNVRGSSGYGREFEDLNNGDWGHGDLKDVLAGVDFLKTLDDVDPENFGITGTSYGGILSMAAVAWAPPGVFKAAIPCSGYGDFVHMANEQELRHIKLLEFEFGKLPEAADVYRHCSPIYDVANATTPCFVLHGEGRYPGSTAGLDFALALEMNYKPVWYKTYPGETYYVAGAANVKQQLQDMKAFFDLNLKGIPHSLPEGVRPHTHLSGVVTAPRRISTQLRPATGAPAGTPPPDVAN